MCRESWKEIDGKTNEPVERTSKHAWISSLPLDAYNLHARCNPAARRRWNTENQIQAEKCNGYNYSRCYACNWNAMKGLHFLMNIAVAMNEPARNCESLFEVFVEKGFAGFIGFVRETLSGPWLDREATEAMLRKKDRLRLAWYAIEKRKTTSEIKRRTGAFNPPYPAINRVARTTSKHDFFKSFKADPYKWHVRTVQVRAAQFKKI